MIEFLRIWFILCVLITHVCGVAPTFQGDLMRLLHSSGINPHRAVELFFIIGGFFLYKRLAQGTGDAFSLIKKTYFRLLPGTLFALFIIVAIWPMSLKVAKLSHLPAALTFLSGTGLTSINVLGWGDWFIGVYFWITCLFIGIFQTKSKYRWLWLGVLIYICFILKCRNIISPDYKADGFGESLYFGIISAGLVRGIPCMGLGMVSAFLAENLAWVPKCPSKIVLTGFEILCMVYIYNFLFNVKSCSMGYIELLLLFGVFMVSIAHSWGYMSTLLNKQSWVQYMSRYTLPTLFGHIICVNALRRFQFFGWGDYQRAIFVIGGGIMLGIIEYHLVEKWLVPKIKAYFQS